MYLFMYVCMCVFVCVCMCVYVYVKEYGLQIPTNWGIWVSAIRMYCPCSNTTCPPIHCHNGFTTSSAL